MQTKEKRMFERITRTATAIIAGTLISTLAGCGDEQPYEPSQQAAQVDAQIEWSQARLLAVQDGGRYKTLDSFARESFSQMVGAEHLPGLSPVGSLLEWLFNKDAYEDVPLIKVRNAGVRARLVRHMPENDQARIMETKRFTPREIRDAKLNTVLREMSTDPMKKNAVNRVRSAQVTARNLDRFLNIIPQPGGDEVAEWFVPQAVLPNLADEHFSQLGLDRSALPTEHQWPVPGVTPQQALNITVAWTSLRAAWLEGDAPAVQRYLNRLTETLPAMASPGVYPSRSQREAEARYYAAGKFTYGWFLYFLALLVSILALVTGWRIPWAIAFILILGGLAIHVYGLSLRWYILDRIPVANMFEAVVASAAIGIAISLLIEIFLTTRVFLVGASATGFLALVAGGFVLPGSELGTIPAILDDIQLRLHTVMVITAYALIFVAAIIAAIYLIGYYAVRLGGRTAPSAPDKAVAQTADGTNIDVDVSNQRPLLAGATPGDEAPSRQLPQWLNNIDWSHLIILNIVFVLLFLGGIILGAWWADYSWGRPWGWDPKEVFALNTFIVYAILIHLRFVVKNRGLWTAWLSLFGCAMMAFNWFFVNFFIASIHSYA